MNTLGFLSWSMVLWRSSTFELRASWFFAIWILFFAVGAIREHNWALLPFVVLVPTLSMYVHAMAHVAVTRLVGGSCDATMLSMLNDYTVMHLPTRPATHFAAGCAGPLVSLLIWMGCEVASHHVYASPLANGVVQFTLFVNQSILLYNLIPCSVFDGARIWRATLWPIVGLNRSAHWTTIAGGICSLGLIALGIYITDMLSLMFGIVCLVTSINEYRSIRSGYDPVTMIDLYAYGQYQQKSSWLARWRSERKVRAAQAHAKEAEREQEILDGLLAKVTEQGLNALSIAERATLQKISKRQRERDNANAG